LRDRTTVLTKASDVLQVAPEYGLTMVLRGARAPRTVSVDLREHPLADRRMDLRSLEFPDASFDFAICSHVLEHIVEDRKAMAELFRVLRPGGILLVMVPWNRKAPKTREDPTVTDPAERTRLYGQADHVRTYGGPDPVDRLHGAGFEVYVDEFGSQLADEIVRRQALSRDPILRCTKPTAKAS
jgi:SAM-dependent methyltransferase